MNWTPRNDVMARAMYRAIRDYARRAARGDVEHERRVLRKYGLVPVPSPAPRKEG